MVDVKSKKMFLKKSPCPQEIAASDFVLGAKVFLYARELDIIDYGDGSTRQRLHHQMQRCAAIITSDVYQDWGVVLKKLEKDMVLVRLKSIQMNDMNADKVTSLLGASPRVQASLTRGVCLLAVFQSENGCDVMNRILEREGLANKGVLVAANGSQTADLTALLLPLKTTSTLDSCTCCVIRPHAVKAKVVGDILDIIIKQGYELSAVDSFQFDKKQSEEFLEVYKGVIPEYPDHVVQLCSGQAVCLEVRAENAVEVFRETAGPWDVEMAKELKPESIRGQFGLDTIRSAVHCTDLAADGQLECEYCFHIVAPSS